MRTILIAALAITGAQCFADDVNLNIVTPRRMTPAEMNHELTMQALDAGNNSEIARLRAENAELRRKLEDADGQIKVLAGVLKATIDKYNELKGVSTATGYASPAPQSASPGSEDSR